MERKRKCRYLVTLAIIYLLSTILLLIGFFTPQWFVSHSENQECSTMGLIRGSCRYPYAYDDNAIDVKGHFMNSVFWMMFTALVIVTISVVMVTVTFVTNLHNNQVFMSFTSVLFGVYYPIAAVLALVSSSMLMTKYPSNVGFSAIISMFAGGLMLMFYGGLLAYDVTYTSGRVKKPERKESKEQPELMKNSLFGYCMAFGTSWLIYCLVCISVHM